MERPVMAVRPGRGAVRRVALGVWLAVLASSPEAVSAQPPRRIELVVITPDPDVYAGFGRALSPLLRRRQLDARFSREARLDEHAVLVALDGLAPGLARVWIDASPGRDDVRVILAHGHGRLLGRRVPHDEAAGGLVLAREQVAQILVAAIDSLIAGEGVGVDADAARAELAALGVTTPPAPTPAPVPAPAPPVEEDPVPGEGERRHAFGLFGAVSLLDTGPATPQGVVGLRSAHRLAATTGGTAGLGWGLALDVEIAWALPVEREGDPLGVRLHGPLGRALLALETGLGGGPLDRRVLLRVRAGIGLDAVRLIPTGSDDEGMAAAPRWEAFAAFPADLGLAVPLGGNVRWRIEAGVDVGGREVRYVLVEDDRRDVVLAPFRARPRLGLGLDAVW